MEKHKEKALESDCLCSKCIFRFQCFTQERVFSDPIYQGLFEALMAKGRSRDEALNEVTNEIKNRMGSNLHTTVDGVDNSTPYIYPYPSTSQPWTIVSDSVILSPQMNGSVQVNYTMIDGEEVSWNAGNEL